MNPLTEHLREAGETYPQHLVKAVGFGITMLAGGVACLVHAILPFLFVTTGSTCISRLHSRLQSRRAAVVEGRRKLASVRVAQGEQLGT